MNSDYQNLSDGTSETYKDDDEGSDIQTCICKYNDVHHGNLCGAGLSERDRQISNDSLCEQCVSLYV